MNQFKLTTGLFGNRPYREPSEADKKRWYEDSLKEIEKEKKIREANRLKKKTFKVGDKVKVTWGGMMGKSITEYGVITKLNCRFVYVYVDKEWNSKEGSCFGYDNVEKI